MKRRTFVASSAAALFASSVNAAADVPYFDLTPKFYDAVVSSGKPFILHFFANWSGTSRAQQTILCNLFGSNTRYREIRYGLTDWDETKDDWQSLGIPRHGTLYGVKGGQFVGRLVAVTDQSQIKALLDAMLAD